MSGAVPEDARICESLVLLPEFERPQEELPLELRASGGPQQGCPGPGGGDYSAMPDAVIRIKDSIAAGAGFLRAPTAVRDSRECVAACCAEPRCSVAVVELPRRPATTDTALGCYLFNCTARGRSVCKFAMRRGYSSYSLSRAREGGQQGLEAGFPSTAWASPRLGGVCLGIQFRRCSEVKIGDLWGRSSFWKNTAMLTLLQVPSNMEMWRRPHSPLQLGEKDEPPVSKAGQDVVLRLPTDAVTLDGRESTDDHAIVQYEWVLLRGDPSVDMKVPQSGTLKLSHLREGTYTVQLTVMDTAGQRSSDNVSVTVLPMAFSTGGCSNVCSRYHFFCDNGCCIDITLACNGVEQCPDGSDEAFCQNLSLSQEMVTHTAAAQPGTTRLSKGAGEGSLLDKSQEATARNWPPVLSNTEKRNHSAFWGPKSQIDPGMPESASLGKNRKEENYVFESKSDRGEGEHPAPETGAVLPLALGVAITALLLLMVACRLRLVKQKLKKARPITSEESDYLINGMYL
ncbi:low-density lipoprotein receptor-related protein 11 [Pteropus alecto]|uniref:low-density lipoprotein receptor-related protein 11 n=1 Tax=Pteropus alecto TaxID=9402 RepID=UPI000D537975|nr:low-density lipoprotein receptor-related protein 11 [Pteropus alecto]